MAFACEFMERSCREQSAMIACVVRVSTMGLANRGMHTPTASCRTNLGFKRRLPGYAEAKATRKFRPPPDARTTSPTAHWQHQQREVLCGKD